MLIRKGQVQQAAPPDGKKRGESRAAGHNEEK